MRGWFGTDQCGVMFRCRQVKVKIHFNVMRTEGAAEAESLTPKSKVEHKIKLAKRTKTEKKVRKDINLTRK